MSKVLGLGQPASSDEKKWMFRGLITLTIVLALSAGYAFELHRVAVAELERQLMVCEQSNQDLKMMIKEDE